MSIPYCVCRVLVLLPQIIDTARIVSDRVCVTIRCPPIRSFVCLSHFAPQVGLLLWARRASDVDRQRRAPGSSSAAARAAARRSDANAGSVTFIADAGGIFVSIASNPKKVKVAHTRLPSVGFRSWSRFLAVSLQVTWVINPTVSFPQACSYPRNP